MNSCFSGSIGATMKEVRDTDEKRETAMSTRVEVQEIGETEVTVGSVRFIIETPKPGDF